MSHYIAAFTRRAGSQEMAVCGTWIPAGTRTNQPSCPACSSYLLDDAADFEALADEVSRPRDAGQPRRVS